MTTFVPPTSLACSVRDCGLPLDRRARTFVCPRGHSYDVARSGYVNLLQPQDRRSLNAGDSKEAVEARARLLAMGVGRALVDEVVQQALALSLSERPIVVDLGSGSGDTLAALATARTIEGIGLDLSTAAAECAARRFPTLTWVVANADRRLPLLDGRVDLVLSLHGRRNPLECARIIAPNGIPPRRDSRAGRSPRTARTRPREGAGTRARRVTACRSRAGFRITASIHGAAGAASPPDRGARPVAHHLPWRTNARARAGCQPLEPRRDARF